MSVWKDILIRRQNGWDVDYHGDDLDTYAKLLGGEVDGKFVRCPSPGRDEDDRSCHVTISRGRPYIYDCEGPDRAAYAYINERLRSVPTSTVPEADRLAQARSIFDNTVPAAGSLVEKYLRSRGIRIPVPDCLRYHPALWCSETKYKLPGMVAPRSGVDGTLVAIHRTFLKYDGTGKAALTMPRKDLGNWKGGAIRLSPVADELMIGEGIETTLAAIEMYGLPGWAAGSAIAMRRLELPDVVKSVIVLADGDDPGEAAARFSAQRWLRERRRVRIARAPRGKDFNDVLIEGAAS